MSVKILVGDAITRLRKLEDESVHCAITSPPYWGMRAYQGGDGMIGLETTFDEHLDNLLRVFREVRRVLRTDGTCFLNYGDAYAGAGVRMAHHANAGISNTVSRNGASTKRIDPTGLKAKDLMMMPARIALALQADGWWLRSEIVWDKLSCMPESVTDRPTSAHEKVFMLTQSGSPTYWTHRDGNGTRTKPSPDYVWIDPDTRRESQAHVTGWKRKNLWRGHDYFYDAVAVRNKPAQWPPGIPGSRAKGVNADRNDNDLAQRVRNKQRGHARSHTGFNKTWDAMTKEEQQANGSSLRNVWRFASGGYPGAHFATFPPSLPERCIKAGTSEHGVCAECGGPWVRIIHTPKVPTHLYSNRSNSGDNLVGNFIRVDGVKRGSGQKVQNWRNQNPTQTTGWQPTCACAADVKPALCLDPFSGAGTVGLVADRLGRDALLIEISPEYAEMARARIASDNLMFADVQVVA